MKAVMERSGPAAAGMLAQPIPLAALLEHLHVTTNGLTTEEAQRLLAAVGPNEPASARRAATLEQILAFMSNPLVVILLIASVVLGCWARSSTPS